MLVKTITSFTLAHNITLTLATLDYINIPVRTKYAGRRTLCIGEKFTTPPMKRVRV